MRSNLATIFPAAASFQGLTGPTLVKRLPITIESDDRRVIVRPFMMGLDRTASLLERVDKLPDEAVDATLAHVRAQYESRHEDLLATFAEHFDAGVALVGWTRQWSLPRRLLAGAYLTMEYSVDSAALFNPSIVPLPDQHGVEPGALRVVMSLRATGEGHVSSIVFHTGTITRDGQVLMDPPARQLTRARISLPRTYAREAFARRLEEMELPIVIVDKICEQLPDPFELPTLHSLIADFKHRTSPEHTETLNVLNRIEHVAMANYRIHLDAGDQLNELVIFPLAKEESRGIEDLRLVKLIEDDGSASYHGTYTAYNGMSTTPMMLSTPDFRTFEIYSINGAAALNKGMAIFPRRIGGKYVMCSRIDGENLYIATSDSLHYWPSAKRIMEPCLPWEFVQLGNCGSPIETEQGWLLLTHGVGPMRSYAIGAILLDLDDPTRVIGHLAEPLIVPDETEREGYVPNVVYTCGLLEHNGVLYIPYAQADKRTGLAVVGRDELLGKLKRL
jgi:predicted GH43/DUF377 family glycosyl hydrolase